MSVPSLSGTDTSFTMCWSPARGTTSQTALTPSRVWTQAGYLGVWHFSPAATARVYANSAQPEHYATASAAATEDANGIIGGYVQFPNGATTLVNDSIAWASCTPHMTLEFWVDNQNKGDARIFGSGSGYQEGASIYMSGYISGNGGHSYRQSSLVPDAGWRHVSMNFSGSAQATALADGVTTFRFSLQGGSSVDGDSTHFFHNVNDGSIYADYHALSLTSHGSGSDMFKGYADDRRTPPRAHGVGLAAARGGPRRERADDRPSVPSVAPWARPYLGKRHPFILKGRDASTTRPPRRQALPSALKITLDFIPNPAKITPVFSNSRRKRWIVLHWPNFANGRRDGAGSRS